MVVENSRVRGLTGLLLLGDGPCLLPWVCAYVPVPVPALTWAGLLLQFPEFPVHAEPDGLLSPRLSQGQDWGRVLAKAY